MMSRKLRKVEGVDDFYRDEKTGVIININSEEIRASRKRRRMIKEKQKEQDNLKDTVKDLQGEMKEIKSLLSQLVEKK